MRNKLIALALINLYAKHFQDILGSVQIQSHPNASMRIRILNDYLRHSAILNKILKLRLGCINRHYCKKKKKKPNNLNNRELK